MILDMFQFGSQRYCLLRGRATQSACTRVGGLRCGVDVWSVLATHNMYENIVLCISISHVTMHYVASLFFAPTSCRQALCLVVSVIHGIAHSPADATHIGEDGVLSCPLVAGAS